MQAVVIYKSKTGFSKKYAEWIAEELQADLFEASQVTSDTLGKYETIVYGGSLYATGILGVSLIKKHLEQLKGKRLVVFGCGASPASAELLAEITEHNFTPAQRQQLKVFYLRGGFNFAKLPPLEKVLMTLFKWGMVVKAKTGAEMGSDEIELLGAFKNAVDFTDRNNIRELLATLTTNS